MSFAFLHTGPLIFVTDCLFKVVYMGNKFGRQRGYFFMEQRASMLVTHYKISGFPKLKVPLLSHHPLHVQVSSDCLLVAPWELGLREVK